VFKVSVIIPVYNVERYLEKCLVSVVNQTLSGIQVIVVNDGSTDNTAHIAKKYRSLCPDRFTYIEKENRGQGDARNTGLEFARGEYIGFVDGDDYIELNMYEKMYNIAKKHNADIVECSYDHVKDGKTIATKNISPYTNEDMLIKTRYSVWDKLVKLSIINNNNLRFPQTLKYEDFEYLCKIVPRITRASCIQDVLYHYVQHGNSTMHSENPKLRDIFGVLENIAAYYKEHGFYDKYREQLEYVFIKELLAASFFRIAALKDKKLRKTILRENWNALQKFFPNWKNNSILNKTKSLKNLYLKSVNKATYYFYSKIFPLLLNHKRLEPFPKPLKIAKESRKGG
jgi:glycosyltransferase involved in cell wall biosynthesis